MLLIIVIMAIFTGEYIVINSMIMTLLAIAIDLIILKITKNCKGRVDEKQYNSKIPIAFILCVENIIFFIVTLLILDFISIL